jgi:transcriptional regulator with XRE-family HTH domain
MQDAKDKRRAALQSHWNAKKLTMERVKAIRLMNEAGMPQKEIADIFGVDASYISKIVSGDRWDRPGC